MPSLSAVVKLSFVNSSDISGRFQYYDHFDAGCTYTGLNFRHYLIAIVFGLAFGQLKAVFIIIDQVLMCTLCCTAQITRH